MKVFLLLFTIVVVFCVVAFTPEGNAFGAKLLGAPAGRSTSAQLYYLTTQGTTFQKLRTWPLRAFVDAVFALFGDVGHCKR